jgi:hypothetical protein
MSLTQLSLAGNNYYSLPRTRESLVSDIPAEDGKFGNLFYSVKKQTNLLSPLGLKQVVEFLEDDDKV